MHDLKDKYARHSCKGIHPTNGAVVSPLRYRRGGRINIAQSFFQPKRVSPKMSAPASLNTRPIPPDRMNLSPASRNTVISGASGRTFMGTRAVRQRVALADTVIPGFTPRMPAIVEEVENPAVELTYPDGDTFGVADADGQVYVKPLHAKRLAVHFCGWVSSQLHDSSHAESQPG